MTSNTMYLLSEIDRSTPIIFCGTCSNARIIEKTAAAAMMKSTFAVVRADSRSRSYVSVQ